jgi:hypothetical protein
MATDLTPFEDIDVIRSAIEMPNAAGGFREALEVDNVELHHGSEGYIVLHYRVRKVRFDEVVKDEPEEGLERVHVFNVDAATFIDEEIVKATFDEQRERIDAAKAAAAAEEQRQREAEQLDAAHADGAHADGLVDGCPSCDGERDAAAAESSDGKPKGRKAAAK